LPRCPRCEQYRNPQVRIGGALAGRADFLIEEDFDRRAYDLAGGSGYDLVAEEAELCVEPRVGRDYWVLSLVHSKELGPQRVEDEARFFGGALTLDDFADRFLATGDGPSRCG
jgi:hypothetical protein